MYNNCPVCNSSEIDYYDCSPEYWYGFCEKCDASFTAVFEFVEFEDIKKEEKDATNNV